MLCLAKACHGLGRAEEARAWLGKVDPAMAVAEAALHYEAKALLGG